MFSVLLFLSCIARSSNKYSVFGYPACLDGSVQGSRGIFHFKNVHTRMEAKSMSASKPHEVNLGYKQRFITDGSEVLRINASSWSFFESGTEILAMAKTIKGINISTSKGHSMWLSFPHLLCIPIPHSIETK